MNQQLAASDGGTMDIAARLKREEVLELAAILGREVWDRRMGLFCTGSRFATKLLEVTARRLESGDRVPRLGRSSVASTTTTANGQEEPSSSSPTKTNDRDATTTTVNQPQARAA